MAPGSNNVERTLAQLVRGLIPEDSPGFAGPDLLTLFRPFFCEMCRCVRSP